MTLGSQVVDLVWLYFLNYSDKIAGIGQVSVVEVEAYIFLVGVVVKMVYSIGIKGG